MFQAIVSQKELGFEHIFVLEHKQELLYKGTSIAPKDVIPKDQIQGRWHVFAYGSVFTTPKQ